MGGGGGLPSRPFPAGMAMAGVYDISAISIVSAIVYDISATL